MQHKKCREEMFLSTKVFPGLIFKGLFKGDLVNFAGKAFQVTCKFKVKQ